MIRRTPVFAMALAGTVVACHRKPPPGDDGSRASATVQAPQSGNPTLPAELEPKAGNQQAPDAGSPRHNGPWLVVTSSAAAVYSEPKFEPRAKIGYVRNGGRVPVTANPVSRQDCSAGWYEIVGGGYICANQGTTDLDHPQVKFALRPPNLDDVLPYAYARNAKNGTPLYRSVPSREQMRLYEPYLDAADRSRSAEGSHGASDLQAASLSRDAGSATIAELGDAGFAPRATLDDEPEKPWWQQDNIKERLHEVKLDQLTEDADDILARRMVAGFYVAIDKTFTWNGRTWYKTTKGLVTPADRFWQTAGSKFHGVELDGVTYKLPVAWVYGGRKSAATYRIDERAGTIQTVGSIERFEPIQLTGRTIEFRRDKYHETKDGSFVKAIYVRATQPGPPPSNLAPNERWIDIQLGSQTLVAFEGQRPIYATLISSGKQSEVAEKDHRTPAGEYRIREKHLTTTMDGDGTAAGDLPYSIEDVPFVMYFHNSYAVHGAFWHRNYGVQMSHGCVNLAPLDAKRLFFLTDPPLPQGWHGAWSTAARPGSRIVIRP